MFIDPNMIDFDLSLKVVKDKIIYEIIGKSFIDEDLDTNGGFTLKNSIIELQHEGYKIPVAVDLTITNLDEFGSIRVDVEVVDDSRLRQELREIIGGI